MNLHTIHIKAIKADDEGRFVDEIVPVVIKNKGDIIFSKDEYINRTTNLDKIKSLRPAFKADGSNSCILIWN